MLQMLPSEMCDGIEVEEHESTHHRYRKCQDNHVGTQVGNGKAQHHGFGVKAESILGRDARVVGNRVSSTSSYPRKEECDGPRNDDTHDDP